MTKHTKGPWTYRDCTPDVTNGRYEGLRYEIWAATLDYHIANTTDGAQQAEANARLIAAAPELLAACESLVDLQGKCASGFPLSENEMRDFAILNFKMREAVNKAKGVI